MLDRQKSSISPPLLIKTRSGLDVRVLVHAGVAAIPRDAWERLSPGEPESWDFYHAGDQAPPPGFTLGAICVELNGQIVAAAPLFRTVYRFDTAVQTGWRRRVGDWLFATVPALVSMRVIGLGSPLTDHCHLGIEAGLSPTQQGEVLEALLEGLRTQARHERTPLLAAKALTTAQSNAVSGTFERLAYTRVTSLPVVMLRLPYRGEAHYLSSLEPGTAAYLKRKFRPLDKLRIEYRTSIVGLEDQLNALYKETLAHSAVDYGDFGQVGPDYFARVLATMGDRAKLMLCWLGDELLSFQLYVVGDRDIVAKCIGMRYPAAKEYNLYFINWLMMIRFALAHGRTRICMGGTTFHTKMLFGGVIEKRWIFFRFRNPIHNAILPWLAPAFDFEKNDLELQALAAGKKFDAPKPPKPPKTDLGKAAGTTSASTGRAKPAPKNECTPPRDGQIDRRPSGAAKPQAPQSTGT